MSQPRHCRRLDLTDWFTRYADVSAGILKRLRPSAADAGSEFEDLAFPLAEDVEHREHLVRQQGRGRPSVLAELGADFAPEVLRRRGPLHVGGPKDDLDTALREAPFGVRQVPERARLTVAQEMEIHTLRLHLD